MNEQENKPSMTEWDKQVFNRLKHIVELEKVGKLNYFTHEEVFGAAEEKIRLAQEKQRAERRKIFNNLQYAV
ncbi:MAG: hypothetical protein LBC86_10535 [Oscillospiraceae bacterium]|jgi:hypothetical protein|nr:hypothetical protein [Oscillospiraceae bacterium]